MRLASVLHGPRDSRASSGFSLIEVLIALTLLGIALLLGMDLVLQNPRVVRRLDGERQAFRAMESTMEAVRAGVIPVGKADSCPTAHSCQDPDCPNANLCSIVRTFGPPPVRPPQPPKDYLTISMQVGAAGLTGLYRVTVVAEYSVLNKKYEKKLQTMVWAPPT
jgi:prepilin-type N-terminal cleavage/methylation domain-containing protein